MIELLLEILMWPITKPFEMLLDRMQSKSRRDDPVYKKNVQDLIERNRRFEKTE
jgi:hypothetical protein